MSDEILTLDDIAELYKVKRQQARDFIVKQPGFPAMVPGSSHRLPRWLKSDVMSYIRRKHRADSAIPA